MSQPDSAHAHRDLDHIHDHDHGPHGVPQPDVNHSPSDEPRSEADTYATANKHHFDAIASTYGNHQRRVDEIGGAMRRTGLFKQGITSVMDFACGTGLISRALAAEDPKTIVGVDISQAMVDRYNQIVSDHGIPPEEMRAVCVEPEEDLGRALENTGVTSVFDVIVCASAYHHLTSIDRVTRSLVTCLKPGGSLLVSDIVHAGSSAPEIFPSDVHHIVPHKGGFTEEDIRSTFEDAGLKNIVFGVIAHVKHQGHPVDLFLARGDRL